jgi:hypothetical protein
LHLKQSKKSGLATPSRVGTVAGRFGSSQPSVNNSRGAPHTKFN